MRYAAVLFLEGGFSEILADYFRRIDSLCLKLGIPPHISLAAFDSAEIPVLREIAEDFVSRRKKISVDMPSVASFLSAEGVIFLAPVVTRALLDLHADFYDRLTRRGIPFDPLYRPGNWVPHCTLDMRVTAAEYPAKMALCAGFPPVMKAGLESIGLIEYYPVKELFRFDFRL